MIRRNDGYSLTEVMITLGVLAILGLIVTQVYQGVLTDTRYRQLSSTRDQVIIQIRQSASNIQGLKNSLKQPENIAFYNCVCGQGAGCNSGQIYPFTLYDIQTTPPTPVIMYYDASGFPCNENTANCLIKVSFKFVAQCMPTLPAADPSPPASCTGQPVELFGILFKIQQNPLTLNQGALLKEVSGTAYTQVSTLNPPGSGVCP